MSNTKQNLKEIWYEVINNFKIKFPAYYKMLNEAGFRAIVEEKRQRFFGRCYFKEKIVSLNLVMHKNSTKDMIVDTCFHEIAHAIDYLQRGKSNHGYQWKRLAKELGCSPMAKSKKSVDVDYNYIYAVEVRDNRFEYLSGTFRKPKYDKVNSYNAALTLKNNNKYVNPRIWLFDKDAWKEIKQRQESAN